MGHARIAALAASVLAVTFTLSGVPAVAGPAAAELTCTAAAVAGTSAGLTMAGPAEEFEITFEPTQAACTDTRPDVKDSQKIIGAKIDAPDPGSGKGTCGELEAKMALRFTWLLANGSEGEPTVLEAEGSLKGEEITKELKLTGGELDGWDVEIAAANAAEVKRHVAVACATEDGVRTIAAQLSLSFSNNPWSKR